MKGMREITTRRRASTLLTLLPLAVLLGAWCAIVLDRSLETAQASAMLSWRLQARAAAEGVAVLIARDPAKLPGEQSLGTATVICRPEASIDPQGATVTMDVSVRPAGVDRVRFSGTYRAVLVRSGGAWRVLRVEE